MTARAMLDTNIVSDLMRDPGGLAWQRLDAFGLYDAGMSIVTAAELRFGIEKRQSAKAQRQFDRVAAVVPILPLDAPADEHYGRLRATLSAGGRPIGPNDLFIAAHALSLDILLVTANTREFMRVPGLKVENWLD